jgi:hypothetical protein
MNYPPEQLAQFPWIVSSDTLKTEHLLVQYWSAAETIHRLRFDGQPWAADQRRLTSELERLVGEDSSESDWSDEEAETLLEALAEHLQDVAPDGFYFGGSEGDGACFGFWLEQDWETALDRLGFGNDDPTGWDEQQAGADYAQQLAQDNWLPDGPNGIGWNRWPLSCIDWSDAWNELKLGDGYRLHDIGGGEWLVFRSV